MPPEPTAPMQREAPGQFMQLWVPFKRLAGVSRALTGASMEWGATPNWESFYDSRLDPHRELIEKHFPVRERGNMAFIILRESGGNANAGCTDCFEVYWLNDRPNWATVHHLASGEGTRPAVSSGGEWRVIREDSQGLLQINKVAWTNFGGDLRDPETNLAAGRVIFDDGRKRFGDPYHHWRSSDPRVTTPRAVI